MYTELKEEIEKVKSGGYPINEFYRLYGQCQMAFRLGAINQSEFMDLNRDVVADGINNPRHFNN